MMRSSSKHCKKKLQDWTNYAVIGNFLPLNNRFTPLKRQSHMKLMHMYVIYELESENSVISI